MELPGLLFFSLKMGRGDRKGKENRRTKRGAVIIITGVTGGRVRLSQGLHSNFLGSLCGMEDL